MGGLLGLEADELFLGGRGGALARFAFVNGELLWERRMPRKMEF